MGGSKEVGLASRKHQCLTCNKAFSSNSHLRRHEVSHSRNQINQCKFCNRGFLRFDALRRHSRTCSQRGNNNPLPASKPGRKPRACDLCRLKKAQCDGGDPCERCSSGQFRCHRSYADANTREPQPGIENPSGSINGRETASQHIPVSFLLNYTDPTLELLVEVFSNQVSDDEAIAEQPQSSSFAEVPSEYIFDNDTPGLFSSLFSDFFMDQNIEFEDTGEMTTLATPVPALQSQVDDIIAHLVVQFRSDPDDYSVLGSEFPVALARAVFTAEKLADYGEAYFKYFHPHFSFIHRPTFDIQSVSSPLLLAITLNGSINIAKDGALSARPFFSLGEAYIFSELGTLSADKEHRSEYSLQVIQAALVTLALQTSSNDEVVRRRIRVNRLPELVASMRSLGFIGSEHSKSHALETWDQFIIKEMSIRTVTAVFFFDCMNTVLFNSPALMTINEMTGDLPCPNNLFAAPTSNEFTHLANELNRSNPSVLKLKSWITMALQDSWPVSEDSLFDSIEPQHLMIYIFALHSIIYNARSGLLVPTLYEVLTRALRRWREAWDIVTKRHGIDQSFPRGFMVNSPELWWLAQKVLDLAKCGDSQSRYMQGIATDSLEDLHRFIQLYGTRKA
ncbi:hypothetical protein BS50DRAFT_197300 [Corynespora cassiicola Philippines]|uniref:Zn(2)-C6 fungal-type domain-containing protein n=1 Tax=Corynespora cassiicola Philippines TaxID=1448308 RepID=A0A2T2N5S0_CORCC|nr:hypothetical protein BS50DRAFT_197300 [Corynespora cassiicola Philippines]